MAKSGDVRNYLPSLLLTEIDECIPWPYSLDRYGYGQCRFRGKVVRVHNWICRQIEGEPPPDMTDAAHLCGNRTCVNHRHIRWASRKTNAGEGHSHTNDQKGEANKMAKLTKEDVRAIRRARASQPKIAARYGIHQTTVSQIKLRKRWKHV
jgi:hypothetical protein